MFSKRDLKKKRTEKLSETDILYEYNEQFQEADENLAEFIHHHSEFMEALRKHVEDRNAKLERVMNELRNRLKNSDRKSLSVGEFSVSARTAESWDVNMLQKLIPDRYFDKVFVPVVSYTVREEELDDLIVRKELSEDVISKALTTKTTIVRGQKIPKEIKVP